MRVFITALIVSLVSSASAFAGIEPMPVTPLPVPTLGEWGFIAMSAVLGIVGFIALNRRLAARAEK